MNQMYGCDIGKFMESVEDSMTYKLSGANMVVAGLMSDAQEQLAHDDAEGARQTLNRAKAVLFRVMDGELKGGGTKEKQEHPWHIELDMMRQKVRFAMENLDELPRRTQVRHNLELVLSCLTELCEVTKGEENANAKL